MTKSNTKIEKQTKRKTNPELVETIRLAKKNKNWLKIAAILSSSRSNKININIGEIKEDSIVPGKVLSLGEASKNKIVAFSFSEKSKEKILKAGGKVISIIEEIKSNPEMKGLKIQK